MIVVEIEKLEAIFARVFDELKNKEMGAIIFDDDWYWSVPIDKMVSFPEEPKLAVGSLSDDVSFLNSIDKDDLVGTFLELERLASVLRFISRRVFNNVVQ